MSAIGGVMEIKRYGIDVSSLNFMRRSMSIRGGKNSAAYIGSGIGLIYSSEEAIDRHPIIYEREGRTIAFCIDSSEVEVGAVLEKYLVYGIEFLEHLCGSFALVLYDSEKNAVILARDKKGKKPLFYSVGENKIYFASEVKGILDAGVSAEVDKEALAMHLISPIGIYLPSDIYSNICEVRAGECVIFTRIGMSRFFYRETPNGNRFAKKSEKNNALEACSTINISNLEEYLNEALIAFDYPQFDCFMPSLIELLRRASDAEEKSLRFVDHVRRRNISYAYIREDRLGALYGVSCVGVLPKIDEQKRVADTSIEEVLRKHLLEMDGERFDFLKSVFGEMRFLEILRALAVPSKKNEDTEYNIRILAMLCQTVEWSESRHLLLK